MTGFARHEGGDGTLTWAWELKSVNGKNLDLRCRVPSGYEALEVAARATAQAHCTRGNLQLSLTVNRGQVPVKLQVNREILDQLLGLMRELEGEVRAEPPRLDGLLAVRGVLEAVEEEETKEQMDVRTAAMEEDLVLALEALTAMRRAEGQRLKAMADGHLAEIERLTAAAGETAAARPEALRARLKAQVEELLEAAPALPEERLAQEAAVLAAKADVREELDRLNAHVAAAHDLLTEGKAIGRRLDFLCQELNREANTLCSKSQDVTLTRIGLDLKAVVDQLREQVQNIE
ncbi:MAG: YicC/YloC family endoribonuclease [Alphaproteobacteria bacterium]